MESQTSIFRNIWLADDDDDDQVIFEEVLKVVLPGSTLRSFYHCEDLLKQLQFEKPDILFLDINIPPFDGKKCLKVIRNNSLLNGLPIIMYSSSAFPADIASSYAYGATLYITKPSGYELMHATLKALLLLDWSDHDLLTRNQYKDRHYCSFEPAT
jgi:DNA-binding response OmpR family regulator